MIALLQRVSAARVQVDGQTRGEIGAGLLALIGIERGYGSDGKSGLLGQRVSYGVLEDAAGRMNLSVREVNGGVLLVPQFTLAADTDAGNRPSFSSAAAPQQARELFEQFVGLARTAYPNVAIGEFGAYMQVSLTNDGPVTFWLQVAPKA